MRSLGLWWTLRVAFWQSKILDMNHRSSYSLSLTASWHIFVICMRTCKRQDIFLALSIQTYIQHMKWNWCGAVRNRTSFLIFHHCDQTAVFNTGVHCFQWYVWMIEKPPWYHGKLKENEFCPCWKKQCNFFFFFFGIPTDTKITTICFTPQLWSLVRTGQDWAIYVLFSKNFQRPLKRCLWLQLYFFQLWFTQCCHSLQQYISPSHLTIVSSEDKVLDMSLKGKSWNSVEGQRKMTNHDYWLMTKMMTMLTFVPML